MKLSIGIVGLPNVGKSTLFKLLTSNDILIANYPFATIDPNVGVVAVPDERVDKLTEMSESKKRIPAIVEFYDIAGLVKGASTGEGLGNQFLTHIRDTSAIVQVLRCFGGTEIIHVENSVDPLRDMEIINTELALKDLETVEKRLLKAEGEARSGPSTSSGQAKKEVEILKKAQSALQSGVSLRASETGVAIQDPVIKNLSLLTAKPKFYLLNGKPEDVPEALKNAITKEGNEYVIIDLATSPFGKGSTAKGGEGFQKANPPSLSDHPPFPKEEDGGISAIITKAYKILGLISFFTTGEDETRAWTIVKGDKAPQAAGVIHTDFEKKFIRAEVVSYKDFVECGDPSTSSGQAGANPWAICRAKGKLRVEGKEYVVADGDIIEVRHG